MNINDFQKVLINFILIVEFIAAFTAILYYAKLKDTYWRWFVFYLVFIFIVESISKWGLNENQDLKKYYYNFFVIPIEFVFLYWLYATKILQKQKLFVWFTGIYIIGCFFYLILKRSMSQLSSISYIIGTFLLTFLVLLEFVRQIKSDSILNFAKNKMFYINTGVMLFYIGTLPFYAFYDVLFENSITLWNYYGTFALMACIIMYLFFTASFIWGKPNI